jgi:hypothetical protein
LYSISAKEKYDSCAEEKKYKPEKKRTIINFMVGEFTKRFFPILRMNP